MLINVFSLQGQKILLADSGSAVRLGRMYNFVNKDSPVYKGGECTYSNNEYNCLKKKSLT